MLPGSHSVIWNFIELQIKKLLDPLLKIKQQKTTELATAPWDCAQLAGARISPSAAEWLCEHIHWEMCLKGQVKVQLFLNC